VALITVALIAALMPFSAVTSPAAAAERDDLFPWQLADVLAPGVAPVGAGFEITLTDLAFILDQIKISEQHVGPTFDPADPCGNLIGPGPNQIPPAGSADQLPFGLRTLSGICNNLVPGQELFGATDEPFIRLATPEWRAAEGFDIDGPGGAPALPNSSYVPGTPNPITPFGPLVVDSQPRIISNLIVDQTPSNPAAIAAAGVGAVPGPSGSFNIENVTPDEGLSAPFNATLTFFGQFFDHGLDLTTKDGELVYMPLQVDDPLFDAGADTIPFTADDGPNFMLISRAQLNDPGAQAINQTSPFVDQNQTYTSSPSQQVFQREYATAGVDPDGGGLLTATSPLDTGRLLEGTVYAGLGGAPGGLTRWIDVKNQAINVLGFELDDVDVLSVPMMAANLYGAYVPGPLRGMPMIVTVGPDLVAGTADDVLVEGDLAAPVSTAALNAVPATAVVPAGRAWLADIAHAAVPGPGLVPDTDETCNPALPGSQLAMFCDDGDPTTYDNEMLDTHFICGDGRCNENIALSAVHHVFHAEHNRVVDDIKATLDASVVPPLDTTEALAFYAEWKPGGVWDGKRLFQAAKFITEMEYQHLAFEEFARTVQPQVNVFVGYDTTIDARIFSEFANTAYRFGHTMLNEDIRRFDTSTGADDSIGLIEAFLNPPEFFADGLGGFTKTAEEAAGGILAGTTTQIGEEIDEFVVEALRNELVGLPLDLAAVNLARGRDTGVPRLNSMRAQIFALTNSSPIFAPYDSWLDFGFSLKTQASLRNFVAAYGIYPDIQAATTLAGKRAAADIALADTAFMTGPPANTGVDDIDLWVGGLAEKNEIFGGLLGSTLNFIFELQMENLQDGDRFYYLHRLEGVPLLAQLEGNSFSEMIERNTTAEQLPANVFTVPTYTFDLDVVAPIPGGGIVDDPATPDWDETLLLVQMPDGTIRYPGADHALFSGRTGAFGPAGDMIQAGEGDDTVRGHDGDDRLEGFGGNDVIIGGAGNDIITDTFGDDDLKGGPGNDALHGGLGFDLLQPGPGDDFAVIGSDPGEIFGGTGDDKLQGGDSFDAIFGGDGDDWINGGSGADAIFGDNAAPLEDNPLGSDGHDVLRGGPGDDAIASEGGDDIMFAGTGTDEFDGIEGFDWVIHKDDPQPADSDLERVEGLPNQVDPLADRFDLVEGLSGWMFDDVLRGDGEIPDLFGGLIPNTLDQNGIDRITDLDLLLPFGATSFDAGNIILGGGGSDLIEGRGTDDIIDGDAWLNVQLLAGGIRYDSMSDLQAMVFDGSLDPGDITIVREILWEPPGTDIDTAEFDGPLADYDITENVNGSVTVVHARGLGDGVGGNCPDINSLCDDGTDTLWNIERLAFSDVIIGAPCADCLLRVTTVPPVASQIIVDGSPTDRWGLTWMKTSPGAHEVCFTDVEGWATAPCETVNVAPGVTGVVNGAFTQQGFIRVVTSPAVQSTISIDGVVRNDWSVWTDFPVGPTEVCYGDVAGFTTPPCETLNVVAGATTNFTGTFVPGAAVAPAGHGLLRVTTSSTLGGGVASQISIDGVTADRWGLNWVKLPPGNYEVCYGDVPNHTTPACSIEVVAAGQTTATNGAFEARGILRVLTQTPHQSTIFVDGVPRNDWGLWTDLPVGPREVCFGEAAGFTPACQSINLVAGVQTTVTGVWP